MTPRRSLHEASTAPCLWLRLLPLMILPLAGCCGLLAMAQHRAMVLRLLERVSKQGAVAYVSTTAVIYPLLLPAPLLHIVAGCCFPLPAAIAINYLSATLGGLISFALGRFAVQDLVQSRINSHPDLQRVSIAIGRKGLLIGFLLRLSPMVPDTWLNYVLGAGPIAALDFLASLCAGEPLYSVTYAYYGHVVGLAALGQVGSSHYASSVGGQAMIVVGVLATVAAVTILASVCQRALRKAVCDEEPFLSNSGSAQIFVQQQID